ncbi:ABC-type transport system ATP-binding protein (probable substrate dipeptide/oligopeptide) (plasmid) [Natrialba magadii ATCC 43099]|uniref:ABC-type transport system ATP-binding protein (Probable substrate dipeptide/oligopeptide) n=1 Tax=Natrialba magadii (strain ATCC 43099 / DSM 3394 / CCM 3739 / CIP 104546 / IAM 13178 / JCM 8861 / NBRC 102185 / NCIMB 2190 / MS3) TaxID=547559 RepID=D3T1R7_NATMM|nr:ABC transporter ATP-binding protein [Natrialba magadii]ADD07526.1 ABC-type transport system ATP-binding protein (probable substrate dipeptide/oligopeptide) [Natrialba magadii ATCC 43099]ELY26562.1 peptide ABC transporter ATPase [Natrialba magadii ATCC 43099]
MTVLEVNNLEVRYEMEEEDVQAVDGVSFALDEGENLGIVGESGCGKSTLAKAILGILPDNGYVNGGEILFDGEDLTDLSQDERRQYMWDEISMIPQSAMTGLDPVYTVREQIVEAIETHRRGMEKATAHETVDELFELVGLDPARADDYSHQFSGGMRQRAMIAMSLALDPAVILADEPTTALDVIMQDQILKRVGQIQDEINSSMIVITHDVSVVAETCDRVLVMYAGALAEEGSVEEIFESPYHPYTVGLKRAFPNIQEPDQDLISIPGYPPDLSPPPAGCRFAPRCPLATDQCFEEDPPEVQTNGLRSRCHHVDRIDSDLRPRADEIETWEDTESWRTQP